MYLDRLAAVALVLISVSVIKTCICCSSRESSECTGKHRQFLGPFTTNKTASFQLMVFLHLAAVIMLNHHTEPSTFPHICHQLVVTHLHYTVSMWHITDSLVLPPHRISFTYVQLVITASPKCPRSVSGCSLWLN